MCGLFVQLPVIHFGQPGLAEIQLSCDLGRRHSTVNAYKR